MGDMSIKDHLSLINECIVSLAVLIWIKNIPSLPDDWNLRENVYGNSEDTQVTSD